MSPITKLLVELGAACAEYQDAALVELPCKHIQCDAILAAIPPRPRWPRGLNAASGRTAISRTTGLSQLSHRYHLLRRSCRVVRMSS
jgi:hypothetical protein